MGRGKSYSTRARLPPASSLRTLGCIVQQVYLKGSAFLLSAGPQFQHSFGACRCVPDWFPPAASQPFANEGTAAGYGETDGPPHLNGFDLAAQASVTSGSQRGTGSQAEARSWNDL